jgi:hypothetical protein
MTITPSPLSQYKSGSLPRVPLHAFFFDLAIDRVTLTLSLFAYIALVKGLCFGQ